MISIGMMIRLIKILEYTHHHALCVLKRGFLEEKCCRRVADVAYVAQRGCGEMVDAPDLGSGFLMEVEVQLFSSAPFHKFFYYYLALAFTFILYLLNANKCLLGGNRFRNLDRYLNTSLRI